MKKLIFLILCLIEITTVGQQSVTDKLLTSIRSGGTGVGYFTINYTVGAYQTTETDVIYINADDTSTITYRIRGSILDTGKNGIDSSFALTANQMSLLNGFYQSASNKTNPDPAVTNMTKGAKGNLTVNFCCGDAIDMTYTSCTHISLIRYLLSYWTNWN
ncbi:MAG TPA: hypothetical protein VK783_04920 [Bacteroidia bacterium]|jgi:hypothetical protein|nr:hypothetical protein [Bacteroidia bacterium]